MTGRPIPWGRSGNEPAGSRAGRAISSMPLRVTAQAKLPPIQHGQPGFDARDLAVNSFVIVFFALVFFAPLVLIGAVAKGFLR